jgi:glycosyltransferase involved in cell wall biosynthesis
MTSLINAGVPASNITTIPNAIDIEKYKPRNDSYRVRKTLAIAKDDPVVLFVGNLTRSKGLDLLIDAMRKVVESVPNARLVVTLELRHSSFDENERALVRQIVDANIQKNVVQLGVIDFMPELLSAIDIAVSPYRNTQGPSDYPLALMEAMASGKCVVGTRTGGLPELIEDGVNGKLVEPGESEALSSALLQLIHSVELRTSLGAAARMFVMQRFAQNEIAEKHLRVYDSVRTRISTRTRGN